MFPSKSVSVACRVTVLVGLIIIVLNCVVDAPLMVVVPVKITSESVFSKSPSFIQLPLTCTFPGVTFPINKPVAVISTSLNVVTAVPFIESVPSKFTTLVLGLNDIPAVLLLIQSPYKSIVLAAATTLSCAAPDICKSPLMVTALVNDFTAGAELLKYKL